MPYPQNTGTAQKAFQLVASCIMTAATLSLPWYVANHKPADMWLSYAGLILLTAAIFTLYHQLFAKKTQG